ncbi:MAG: hypothetical protein HYR67_09615 [Bacteroidetes bacterium]|nr:hypothetical protein [Bacteroidota bacterium]
MNQKKIFFTAAFGLLFVFAQAQENYKEIFSTDYDKAIRFLEDEKWMDEMILSCGLKPKEVKAVIFPELIRYNTIQDKIETFALESLYIQYGKDYANFSIGQFQIKPSFAETIEIDFLKTFGKLKIQNWRPDFKDTIQNQANRLARLKRIKDKKEMVTYLCLFFKVMESKYPDWRDENEKIKFFACAYNLDYRKSREEIIPFITKKFFHTGMISSKKYCYADVAWYYYQQK